MLCRLSVIETWQYSNKKVDIVAAARNQILSDTRSSYVLFTGTHSNGVLVYIFDSIFFFRHVCFHLVLYFGFSAMPCGSLGL